MELQILNESFSLDNNQTPVSLIDMVKAFDSEDKDDSIDLGGEKAEILKFALNDYINTRVSAIS